MRPPLAAWALSALFAVAATDPARAAADATFGGAPLVLNDSELAGERGGLATPIGMDIGFGAVVRTFVDGELALESTLTWTTAGAATAVTAGAESRLLDNAAAAGLAAPEGAWRGVVLPGDGGETTILQDIGEGRIANLVVNTANNRDVRQDITVSLEIPGLAQLQSNFAADRMQLRLQDAVGSALRDAALR